MEVKRIRGVKDILPEEVEKIKTVLNICTETLIKFGFREVILPTIENLELYRHSVGQTSDIVEKQMFQIAPRSDQPSNEIMVLRPEGTAGLVRMFVENNLKEKFALKRFFYFGPMFRYERPQKGRYREFYQLGMEILGEPPPLSDLLLIKIINIIFDKLHVKYELEVNSIGCETCRTNFISVIKNKFSQIKNYLCDTCKNRVDKNPLRIFDCKTDRQQIEEKFNLLDKLNIQKFLCNNCDKNFNDTLHLMNENRIKYKSIPTLVRGLDYYNGFVFEYKTKFLDAAQNTLCAGGRYDSLINAVDKQTIYGCGAAFGIDRMIDVIKIHTEDTRIKIGIAVINDQFLPSATKIADLLSKGEKIIIIGPFSNKSLRSQLRLFNNENCKFVIFVGEEIKEEKVTVKNFVSNIQEVVEIKNLLQFLGV